MSARTIDRRLASGEWVRIFQGAYRLGGAECTWEQTIMAGCLAAGPGAVASHRAAATLLGIPGVPRWVEVTVPESRRVELEGVIAHRTRNLAPEDIGAVKGIPATRAARTIVDLADVYSSARLGPMLNHAMAQRLLRRGKLVGRSAGRRGAGVLAVLLNERPALARPMGSDFEVALFFHSWSAPSERSTSQGGFAAYRLASLGGCYSPLDPPPPGLPNPEVGTRVVNPQSQGLIMGQQVEVARRVGRALEARRVG